MADQTISPDDPMPAWSFEIDLPPPKRARVFFSRVYGRTKDAVTCRLAQLLGDDGCCWLEPDGLLRTRQPLPTKFDLCTHHWIKIHDWPWCRITALESGHVNDGRWVTIRFAVGKIT